MPVPQLVDGPLPRPPSIGFAEWWDRTRRGERTIELHPPDETADDEIIEQSAAAPVPPVSGAVPLRALILAAGKPREELVAVPEWGGVTVAVRALDGERLMRWSTLIALPMALVVHGGPPVPPVAILAVAVVLGCFDPETGARVFTEDDLAVVAALDGAGSERIMVALDPPLPPR